ncbi:hypothetical protein U8V72_14485 [Priestia filamentosa]|uniref:hypothetical protein n=1 Tax=Priestia filamentosa TaxID=1402861 RepID=UPI00058907A3
MKVPYSKICHTQLEPKETIKDIKAYIENKISNKQTFTLYVLVDESKGFPIFCTIYNFEDDDTDLIQVETSYLHPHNSALHFMGDENGLNEELYEHLVEKQVFTHEDLEYVQERKTLYHGSLMEDISWTDYINV